MFHVEHLENSAGRVPRGTLIALADNEELPPVILSKALNSNDFQWREE